MFPINKSLYEFYLGSIKIWLQRLQTGVITRPSFADLKGGNPLLLQHKHQGKYISDSLSSLADKLPMLQKKILFPWVFRWAHTRFLVRSYQKILTRVLQKVVTKISSLNILCRTSSYHERRAVFNTSTCFGTVRLLYQLKFEIIPSIDIGKESNCHLKSWSHMSV